MSDVGNQHFFIGRMEVVIFDIATHIDISTSSKRKPNQRTSAAAANGDFLHRFLQIPVLTHHFHAENIL